MSRLEVEAPDGTPLYVESHGDGPPILFSCAYCTTSENWRPQVAPLVAAGARVLLWDYRGHGRSGAPSKDSAYSMDRVVEDLGAVLDRAAPGQPAVLAGLSFGGLASLHFTYRNPGRVRGLVLVGSGPGFKKPEALARWQRLVGRTGDFLQKRGFADFVAGPAGATCIGRRPELPAARAAARAIEAQDTAAVARFGRLIAGPAPSVIDELPEIRVPALVLVGSEDEAYLRAADVMESKLPAAEKRVVADAGHILNLEQTDVFNEAVIGFLRGLGA